MKNIYCACYNTLYVFTSRENGIKYFKECADFCDPMSCEYSRYTNIIMDLMYSTIGTDRNSFSVWEICYFDKNNKIIKKEEIERENTDKVIERIEKESK